MNVTVLHDCPPKDFKPLEDWLRTIPIDKTTAYDYDWPYRKEYIYHIAKKIAIKIKCRFSPQEKKVRIWRIG